MRRRTAIGLLALVLALAGAGGVLVVRESGGEREREGEAIGGADGTGPAASRPRAPRARAAAPSVPAPRAGKAAATAGAASPPVPTRDVRGTVRTAGGVPVRGARVEVRDHRGAVLGTTVTDDEGAYRIDGVPQVKLSIAVAAHVRDGRATLAALASPAPDGASTDIVVPDGCVVSGRVVGPDGLGVPDADLRVWTRGHRETQMREPVIGRSGADGSFSIAVPSGCTRLAADPTTRGDSGRRWWFGWAEFPEGGAAGVEVRCAESARIEGTVRNASGQPLAGARLVFSAVDLPTVATSRADGSIVCGGLAIGGPSNVSVDPSDTAHAGLVVSPGAVSPKETGPVTFVLHEPVTLRGRVVDATNAPVRNFTVWITQTAGGIEFTARTDADGRFEVARCAPGRYRVRVTWIPNFERERTHVVGEIEAGAPETVLTYPEVFTR